MKEEDFDHIISEPFLTEEGFVNEACMNELNKAIENMPPAYERLADRPEWSEKKDKWTFKKDIVAAFAKWAIRQSGYACPDNLEKVVGYLDACLDKMVDWDTCGMTELSLCDINRLLHEILMDQGISFFDDWNKAKKEWRSDSRFDCMGEAEKVDPDFGFIDLHALLKNVCLDIRTDRRDFEAFNKKFDEEQKEIEKNEQREE